jgi:hypothetical protein
MHPLQQDPLAKSLPNFMRALWTLDLGIWRTKSPRKKTPQGGQSEGGACWVHQCKGPVAGEDDHVDGRGVIGHADTVRLGPILPAVEVDHGGERARHNAEHGQR